MTMKRCDKGHDYDAGKYTMCPDCCSVIPDSDVANIESTDDFFTLAWDEINDRSKTPNKALWAKSFAFSEGDEKRTQAKYIELRVEQLQENHDNNKRAMVIEEEKRARAEATKRADEEKRSRYKVLQNRLQPIAAKIQSLGNFDDAEKLIEELKGSVLIRFNTNGKSEIVVSLDGNTYRFSDAPECTSWLKKNIVPFILDDTEFLPKSDDQPTPLLPGIPINPENITQQKQPPQEQQRTSAITKSDFVPPKPSPQGSTVFAAPTEKPRQLMSSRLDKGKNWFKWVLYILGAASAVKLLFALGHNDPGKKIAEALFFFIGGLILFGGGAFALGWLTGAEPDSNKFKP